VFEIIFEGIIHVVDSIQVKVEITQQNCSGSVSYPDNLELLSELSLWVRLFGVLKLL
jgi:hypothetical protein